MQDTTAPPSVETRLGIIHRNLKVLEVLTLEECAKIVSHLTSSSYGKLDGDGESCLRYERLPPELESIVEQGIVKAIQQYASEVGEFVYASGADIQDEGYTILGFDPGQFHKALTEGTAPMGPSAGRLLVVHLWLNDNFRGGELIVYPDMRPYEPRTGYAVIFPATWEHSYFCKEVVSSRKYVIYTFIRRQLLAEGVVSE